MRSTVLGVLAAALVAAWLPFTVLFISATQHPPAQIISTKAAGPGSRVITTRTSSGQLVRSAVPSGQPQSFVSQPGPVTSKSS